MPRSEDVPGCDGASDCHRRADDVHALGGDDIRQPAHGQQQGDDRHGIADHQPLDAGDIGLEIGRYGRQGNSYAAVVDHGGEDAYRQRGEGVPLVVAASRERRYHDCVTGTSEATRYSPAKNRRGFSTVIW